MPTRNVNLTEHYDRFIAEEIGSGRYHNASEVVRAGLRLLEQHDQETQQRLAALRALAAQGFGELDQGKGIELDGERQLKAFIARLGRQGAPKSKLAATRGKRRPKEA